MPWYEVHIRLSTLRNRSQDVDLIYSYMIWSSPHYLFTFKFFNSLSNFLSCNSWIYSLNNMIYDLLIKIWYIMWIYVALLGHWGFSECRKIIDWNVRLFSPLASKLRFYKFSLGLVTHNFFHFLFNCFFFCVSSFSNVKSFCIVFLVHIVLLLMYSFCCVCIDVSLFCSFKTKR